MAEHLGEMRLPAWRSKRWQDFHTLHIWLGKHSCCLIQANQILRWHQQTEPIQPETVVELLKGQQYKRCRLLLELPWIWLEAAETISVRTEEWPFYLRHHLQLSKLPGPQQPVGWQHLKGSPPKLSWPNSVHRLASYNACSHKDDHAHYRSCQHLSLIHI